jgi:transposase
MNRWQTVKPEQKYTAKQFDREFPTEDACLEYVMQKRFPGAIALCVQCNIARKHYRVTGRTSYACHACGNHIYPLAGTIFHKSTTPLRTWFYVIRLMASTRVGISAKQIQRETGVTYKTAWRMMKQIRLLMGDKIWLKGPVEMDEAYFNTRLHSKATVFGVVERKVYAPEQK